ncbi:MAG: tyrosine-type recombinase/integrase, partial [Endozoicomonadaceae bacterium]|nr:tyrosine-type recombinase/integrase [Endozoicomonadaceae bacterium]
ERQSMEKARLNYIFALTYGAALRESELASHTCKAIRPDKNSELTLYLLGKGRRLRQLPVTPDMFQAINTYRTFHGAGSFTADDFPLAPALRPVKVAATGHQVFRSIKVRQIRTWFSQFMAYCADQVIASNADLANRLEQKSFHSLRHTALSHLAKQMDIEDLSVFAGHESITTTQQYYTPERERLRALTKDHQLHNR